MPKRKTHDVISILFLGKPFSSVSKTLDSPAKVLGKSHRKLMHTIPESFLVGLLVSGDFEGGLSGVLHVIVDAVDSEAKRELRKLAGQRRDEVASKKEKEQRK